MRYATILFKTSLLHYNYYTSVPAFLLQSLGQAVSLRFCLRNGFDVGKLGVGLRHDAEIGQFFPRLRCGPGSARPASRRNCPANRREPGFPSGPRPHAAPAAGPPPPPSPPPPSQASEYPAWCPLLVVSWRIYYILIIPYHPEKVKEMYLKSAKRNTGVDSLCSFVIARPVRTMAAALASRRRIPDLSFRAQREIRIPRFVISSAARNPHPPSPDP